MQKYKCSHNAIHQTAQRILVMIPIIINKVNFIYKIMIITLSYQQNNDIISTRVKECKIHIDIK